jgi:CDP-diacylglycerol--glycerol-3-phosphate 3-phosphatidyltransferase
MISKQIGRFYMYPRNAVARALMGLGLRPNHISVLGMLLTVGAGASLAAGREYWSAWFVWLLVGAGACDLLDGAMAKLGGFESRFGGLLDSVCDRVGDAALYLGPAFYYIARPGAPEADAQPNLTLAALACVGLVWAYLISYIKARAETAGGRAGGGFWQRPERVVTILLGGGFGHVATALWILALWPLATIAHRLWRAARSCAAADRAASAPAGPAQAADLADDDPRGLLGLVLWRYRRHTVPFDIHAGTVILMLIFWDIPETDWLRKLFALVLGHS